MTSTPTPGGRGDVPEPDAPVARAAPLTIEDFRSLRRWLALLGLIAAAALAVAVFAVVRAEESDRESADRGQVAERVRSLDDRLEELEERTARASEESDTARLDRRLRRVEDNLAAAVDGASDAREDVGELDERVRSLAEEVRARR